MRKSSSLVFAIATAFALAFSMQADYDLAARQMAIQRTDVAEIVQMHAGELASLERDLLQPSVPNPGTAMSMVHVEGRRPGAIRGV